MAREIVPTLLAILVLISVSSISAAAAVDDPVKLLPRDRAVNEWVREGPEMFYFDFSLERMVDQTTSDVVFEYGFVSMLSQYYSLGDDLIEIRIYEMESGEDAFGLYSVFADIPRELELGELQFYDSEKDIQNSTTSESRWVNDKEYHIVGDNFFVQLVTETEGYKTDLLRLGGKIQSKFDKSGGDMPGLDLFKGEDRIFSTGRLVGGPSTLGLYLNLGRFDPFLLEETEARCLMSEYHQENGRVYKQIVIEYEDEDTSTEAYLSFRDWVDSVVYYRRLKIADAHGTIYAEDEYENHHGVYIDGNILRLLIDFDVLEELEETINRLCRGD